MRTFYQFHGGCLHGSTMVRSEVELLAEGHTPDRTYDRAMGCLVPRKELDKQPKVPGYLGPMWDGERYLLNDGQLVYTFQKFDPGAIVETVAVLRYETQEVYNQFAD